LKSPIVHEFSTSYGVNVANGRGYAEGSYVFRRTVNLIDDFIDRTTGTTNVTVLGVSAGTFTNILYKNVDSDLAHRQFQALVFQSRYRLRNNWSVNGQYTVQLQNDGNYEGEETNRPGEVSTIGDFPEIYPADRYFPEGRLQNFERNRFRLWSVYNFGMGRVGDLSVSGLLRVEGSRAFSFGTTGITPNATQTAILAAAGYPDVPGDTTLFYGGEKGTGQFPGFGLLDLSINYNIPVFRSLRPWLKFDIYNALDNQKLIAFNTTVNPNNSGPTDALGLATTFTQGANFGRASGNTVTNLNISGIDAFPRAFSAADGAPAGGRTFRVALGFRF